MPEIAADPTHVWHSNREQVRLDDVPGTRLAAPPARPHVAKPVARAKVPEGSGWLHEMQIEGRRLLTRAVMNQGVDLFDEAGKRLPARTAARYEKVANAVRLLPAQNLVVDGVLTALYPDGRPRDEGLAAALAGEGPASLAYYLTDLLFLDGHDLGEAPLARRKALLAELITRVRPPRRAAPLGSLRRRRCCVLSRGLPARYSRDRLAARRLGRTAPPGRRRRHRVRGARHASAPPTEDALGVRPRSLAREPDLVAVHRVDARRVDATVLRSEAQRARDAFE
jgi:hypothetical protein